MAYTCKNFKTKKELREAVERTDVAVYQPGPFGPDIKDGIIVFEGPHAPEPHRWYASAPVKNGVIPKGSKVK
jgi:hypothetical protein